MAISGTNRLIIAKITESGLKGKALVDALYREMCQGEKSASYQKKNTNHGDKPKKK